MYLENTFSGDINERSLCKILIQLEEKNLGDFFANSKFLKLPISANFVKKFTLYTLFDVKVVTKEQFLKFSPISKFEFISAQKTISWVNLLDKSKLIEFLNLYNVQCGDGATFSELRNLLTASLKL